MTDIYIRIPAVRARDLAQLTTAVREVCSTLGLHYIGETTRQIGHFISLDTAPKGSRPGAAAVRATKLGAGLSGSHASRPTKQPPTSSNLRD